MIKNTAQFLLSSLVTVFFFVSISCTTLPKGNPDDTPDIPDYATMSNWAAHPDKKDKADLVPNTTTKIDQNLLSADVFFIHPTTYTKKPIDDKWNASINNQKLNERTDATTIQYQGSIFNKAGRVYAPRYRQAHIRAYYTVDKSITKKVFELAYQDVKTAFEYYLNNYNDGRPFIIASHSQGTQHGTRLIKELVDGQSLQNQLIAAYLIGMPVVKDVFQSIPPCVDKDDTGCFISWRTYKQGHLPKHSPLGDSIVVHNPLTWTQDKDYSAKELNKGAVIRNFNKIYPGATDAQVHNGILWAAKPKFALSFLFTRKNFHIADLNFYYMNVQTNAVNRVKQFIN